MGVAVSEWVRLTPLFWTDRVQKDGDENDCSLHELYPERGHVQEVEAISQPADGQKPETCCDHVSFPRRKEKRHRETRCFAVSTDRVHFGPNTVWARTKCMMVKTITVAMIGTDMPNRVPPPKKLKLSGSPNTVWPFESASVKPRPIAEVERVAMKAGRPKRRLQRPLKAPISRPTKMEIAALASAVFTRTVERAGPGTWESKATTYFCTISPFGRTGRGGPPDSLMVQREIEVTVRSTPGNSRILESRRRRDAGESVRIFSM